MSKYGLIPEFIGRLPVIAVLDELDESALVDILSKPKMPWSNSTRDCFGYEDVKLTFTSEAMNAVARSYQNVKHWELEAARSHRIFNARYNVRNSQQAKYKEVIIDERVITDGAQPKLILKDGQTVESSPAESA